MWELKRCGFDPWVGKIPWWKKWQLILVFLLGEPHGQRTLVGYRPWGHKDSDMAEHLTAFSIRTQEACKKARRAEPQDEPEAGAQPLPCLSCVLRRVHSHSRMSRSPGIHQNLLKTLWTPPHFQILLLKFLFIFFFACHLTTDYLPAFSSVQFSHLVMSNSLWPHERQHTRPPCPSPTPRVQLNPCPLSQ